MGTAQSRRQIPNPKIQFRVLVIGRANAGKTSILQRVCETTESPTIYQGKEEVRTMVQAFCLRVDSELLTRLHLTRQWMLVMMILLVSCL
jgi:septin family protein